MPRSLYTSIGQKYAAPLVLHGTINIDLRLSHLQENVLRFFCVHRIATANLIQRTYPTEFPYHKKTMRCLRALVEHGLLNEHKPATKFDDILFTITEEGYRLARDLPDIDLGIIPYKYEAPTGKQADHELLITETAVRLYEYAMSRRGVQILKDGRFGNDGGAFSTKIPDFRFLSADANGLMLHLVEVIAGSESTDVRETFEGWDAWRRTEEAQQYLLDLYRQYGAEQPQVELRVDCIIHSRNWKYTDAWKERLVLQQSMQVSKWLQARIQTTTVTALSAAIDNGMGINHPIWHRGADLIDEHRSRWEIGEYAHARDFDAVVQQLPTHSLFA